MLIMPTANKIYPHQLEKNICICLRKLIMSAPRYYEIERHRKNFQINFYELSGIVHRLAAAHCKYVKINEIEAKNVRHLYFEALKQIAQKYFESEWAYFLCLKSKRTPKKELFYTFFNPVFEAKKSLPIKLHKYDLPSNPFELTTGNKAFYITFTLALHLSIVGLCLAGAGALNKCLIIGLGIGIGFASTGTFVLLFLALMVITFSVFMIISTFMNKLDPFTTTIDPGLSPSNKIVVDQAHTEIDVSISDIDLHDIVSGQHEKLFPNDRHLATLKSNTKVLASGYQMEDCILSRLPPETLFDILMMTTPKSPITEKEAAFVINSFM